MNNICPSFRKDLNHSYMIIKDEQPVSNVQFHLKMLKHNSVAGLLPISDESLDGETNYLYDISAKQSFGKIFETEKMSYDILSLLINNLKSLGNVLDDYLLDLKYVLIQPEFIYTNMERDQFFFCYYPSIISQESDQFSDIRNFFNQILSTIDYSDSKVVSLAFSISRMVQNDGFTLHGLPSVALLPDNFQPEILPETVPVENNTLLFPSAEGLVSSNTPSTFWDKAKNYFSEKDFSEVIDDINSGVIIKKIREIYVRGPESTNIEVTDINDTQKTFQVYDLNIDESFSKTDEQTYTDISTTAALNSELLSVPCLVGTGLQSGVKISLDHFPFTIGKKTDSSDYVINDPTVSRCHCRFYKAGDEYYLEDLNSTNGSFVNNERIDTYTKYRLSYGDLVKLSSQEFYFH